MAPLGRERGLHKKGEGRASRGAAAAAAPLSARPPPCWPEWRRGSGPARWQRRPPPAPGSRREWRWPQPQPPPLRPPPPPRRRRRRLRPPLRLPGPRERARVSWRWGAERRRRPRRQRLAWRRQGWRERWVHCSGASWRLHCAPWSCCLPACSSMCCLHVLPACQSRHGGRLQAPARHPEWAAAARCLLAFRHTPANPHAR